MFQKQKSLHCNIFETKNQPDRLKKSSFNLHRSLLATLMFILLKFTPTSLIFSSKNTRSYSLPRVATISTNVFTLHISTTIFNKIKNKIVVYFMLEATEDKTRDDKGVHYANIITEYNPEDEKFPALSRLHFKTILTQACLAAKTLLLRFTISK